MTDIHHALVHSPTDYLTGLEQAEARSPELSLGLHVLEPPDAVSQDMSTGNCNEEEGQGSYSGIYLWDARVQSLNNHTYAYHHLFLDGLFWSKVS